MIWLAALALVALALARLRPLRGGLAPPPRARGRDRGAAARARRPPDRAPLRLPPRRAVARPRRDRARGGLGGRAAARSRLRHRRPRLASARRAAARAAARHARAAVRRPRQPRRRRHARSVLAGGGARRPRARWRVLLRDEAVVVERGGRRIQIVGVDAESYPRGTARPWELADPDADLRILLCHFPDIERRLPAGAFQLVLAGHLHAGQIVLPYPGGQGHAGASGSAVRRGPLSREPAACCTSRRAPARRSCRSASSPGRR